MIHFQIYVLYHKPVTMTFFQDFHSMIALLQRVSEASVLVNEKSSNTTLPGERSAEVIATIGAGILALVAVEKGDTQAQADRLLQRILAYRMFEDENGRMNLSLQRTGGQLLLVSQFTLAANTNSGNRPSFTPAAEPKDGKRLFDYLLESAHRELGNVPSGRFGAYMQVSLVNDGPVTFSLRVPPSNP
jgi:D-tyrosyl-tRNA(Tyr) deacylase